MGKYLHFRYRFSKMKKGELKSDVMRGLVCCCATDGEFLSGAGMCINDFTNTLCPQLLLSNTRA